MERRPVNSSVIRSIGYDADAKVLEVEFRTARIYQYFEVPARVHEDLLHAKSIGEFFNHQIRKEYRSVEVTKN
jgi:hypothetical protein